MPFGSFSITLVPTDPLALENQQSQCWSHEMF